MEAGEGDELEAVAERREVALERRDLGVAQVLAPVERRRAVVGEELAGELLVDRGGELLGLRHVGRRRLAPDQVGVGGVGEAARDRGVDAVADAEEALRRALAGAELAVDLVDVARQERGRERVGARDDQRRHVGDVGREPRRDERADVLGGRHEHLAAEVAALLLGRELVLEVDRRRAGLDERLHDLVAR